MCTYHPEKLKIGSVGPRSEIIGLQGDRVKKMKESNVGITGYSRFALPKKSFCKQATGMPWAAIPDR